MSTTMERLKVLIVEDNPAFQELYEEILEADYNLEAAKNKEEAFAYVRRNEPDIALVDMRLEAKERGNTDGLDVAQLIRDLGYKTEIILKSGFPTETPQITARLERLNIFAVLEKSANDQVRELVDAIAKASLALKNKNTSK